MAKGGKHDEQGPRIQKERRYLETGRAQQQGAFTQNIETSVSERGEQLR